MSVRDVIRNSVLNSASYNTDWQTIVVSLLAAVLLGCFIFLIYRHFFSGVIYSRSFSVTLVGMCVMTCMVTIAISTNVVISLGMVGALSIVRYRTAIKDPMDLLYLFWAITSGITAGASMYLLALLSCIIMTIVIYVFYGRKATQEAYVAVVHYADDETGDLILKELSRLKQHFIVKSKTMRMGQTELTLEIAVRKQDFFFEEKLRAIEGVSDVTLIEYNGEYHG